MRLSLDDFGHLFDVRPSEGTQSSRHSTVFRCLQRLLCLLRKDAKAFRVSYFAVWMFDVARIFCAPLRMPGDGGA